MKTLIACILVAISFTGIGILLGYKIYKKKNKITGSTSDGYHTFDELYYYRLLYNANLVNALSFHKESDCSCFYKLPIYICKSHRHSDGELCFGGGWFVVVMQTPIGQITNHYEDKYWDLFICNEVSKAPKWDGHTPKKAAERLYDLANYFRYRLNGN